MEAGQTSSNTGPSGNSSDFVCSSQCLVRSSFLTLVGAKTLQVSLNCRFFRLLLRLLPLPPVPASSKMRSSTHRLRNASSLDSDLLTVAKDVGGPVIFGNRALG